MITDLHEHPVDPERVARARARGLSAEDAGRLSGLRLLRTAGLVVTRKSGRVVFYRLGPEFPAPLREHCLRQLVAMTRADTGEE